MKLRWPSWLVQPSGPPTRAGKAGASAGAALPQAQPTPDAGTTPGTARHTALLAALAQSPLTARWRGLQRQFDQRTQRERLLLVGAVTAAALLLGDALWLGPALAQYRSAQTRLKTAQHDMASLQTDARTQQDVGHQQARQQQAELVMWRQRLREGEAQLRSHEDTLVGPDRMVALLEQLLARHGTVKVRALRSLGRSDLLGAAGVAEPSKTGASAAMASTAASGANTTSTGQSNQSANPTLYRHGVELVLEGSFADVLQYLRDVEALPQRVLWGSVSLKVEQHPRCVLTLRAYTISRDRHWLEI